jgi:hypothetical protein
MISQLLQAYGIVCGMTDEPHWTAYDYRIPERTPMPGELLFEFAIARQLSLA